MTREARDQTLVEIIDTVNYIEKAIIESGGEIPPEIEKQLDKVSEDLQDKVDSYAYVMDVIGQKADFWKTKARTIQKTGSALEKTLERIKSQIKFAMSRGNLTEVKGQEVRFVLSRSKSHRLEIDLEDLPDSWKMEVTELIPDKDRIETALRNKEVVPGARLIQTTTLRQYAASPDIDATKKRK